MKSDGIRRAEPTMCELAFYKTPVHRQEFFERVCAQTPPVQPAFLKRPFFTRRKRDPQLPTDEGT